MVGSGRDSFLCGLELSSIGVSKILESFKWARDSFGQCGYDCDRGKSPTQENKLDGQGPSNDARDMI